MAIQSVSAWPEKRDEIRRMMEVAAKDIERLGGTTQLMDIGKQKVHEHLNVSLVEVFSLENKMFCTGDCWLPIILPRKAFRLHKVSFKMLFMLTSF